MYKELLVTSSRLDNMHSFFSHRPSCLIFTLRKFGNCLYVCHLLQGPSHTNNFLFKHEEDERRKTCHSSKLKRVARWREETLTNISPDVERKISIRTIVDWKGSKTV